MIETVVVQNKNGETRSGKFMFKNEKNMICAKFIPFLQEKSNTALFYFDLNTKKQVIWTCGCGRFVLSDEWIVKEINES